MNCTIFADLSQTIGKLQLNSRIKPRMYVRCSTMCENNRETSAKSENQASDVCKP